MRERRGQLRAWGYSFATDALGMTYPDSLDNQINRVIPPPVLPNWEETIPLSQLREQGECLMGSSDSRGLRLRYTEGKIEVFPRSCPHEGAPLDQAKCHEGQLQCPWHGRKLSSLASFFSTQPQLIQLPFHTIRFDSRQLVVSSHPLVHRAESSCELQP